MIRTYETGVLSTLVVNITHGLIVVRISNVDYISNRIAILLLSVDEVCFEVGAQDSPARCAWRKISSPKPRETIVHRGLCHGCCYCCPCSHRHHRCCSSWCCWILAFCYPSCPVVYCHRCRHCCPPSRPCSSWACKGGSAVAGNGVCAARRASNPVPGVGCLMRKRFDYKTGIKKLTVPITTWVVWWQRTIDPHPCRSSRTGEPW